MNELSLVSRADDLEDGSDLQLVVLDREILNVAVWERGLDAPFLELAGDILSSRGLAFVSAPPPPHGVGRQGAVVLIGSLAVEDRLLRLLFGGRHRERQARDDHYAEDPSDFHATSSFKNTLIIINPGQMKRCCLRPRSGSSGFLKPYPRKDVAGERKVAGEGPREVARLVMEKEVDEEKIERDLKEENTQPRSLFAPQQK